MNIKVSKGTYVQVYKVLYAKKEKNRGTYLYARENNNNNHSACVKMAEVFEISERGVFFL